MPSASAPVLSGELGLLSLFDLGQLFMLNGATGELSVTRDGRRGYLYFDRGQIVNAVDDEYHEGDGAAFVLFTWKSGTFEFRAQPHTGARAVTESTEGLMLEAARRMDELGLGDDGEAARLKQRASALDALREAFQSVARETGNDVPWARRRRGDPLALLAGEVTRCCCGPAARRACAGTARGATPARSRSCAYERVARAPRRQRRTRGARGVRAGVVGADDGRRYAVARVAGEHEALWVRLASLPAPALASLPGGDAVAAQLAGVRGLLVVGAPDGAAADRFFHAVVAHLAAASAEPVLLVSDAGRWSLADGEGAVIRAAGRDADAALRACAPGVAAYDAMQCAASAGALGAAPLVVAAVVLAGPDALLDAWRLRTGIAEGSALERLGVTLAFASAGGDTARLTLARRCGRRRPRPRPPRARTRGAPPGHPPLPEEHRMLTWAIVAFVLVDIVVMVIVMRAVFAPRRARRHARLKRIMALSEDMERETEQYLRAHWSGDPTTLPLALRSLLDTFEARAREQRSA